MKLISYIVYMNIKGYLKKPFWFKLVQITAITLLSTNVYLLLKILSILQQ